MTPKLVIIGDLAFDHTITPKGKKTSIGGSVYNVAVAASKFAKPHSVGVVAKVGDDFGKEISSLTRRGVDTTGIFVVKEGKTAACTITELQDNTRTLNMDWGVGENVDTSIFPESYLTAPYIHLASSHPKKYLEWISYIKKHAPHATLTTDANDFWIDSAVSETVEALMAVDMVFMNELEYQAMGKDAEKIVSLKPSILKRGKNGAVYIDEKKNRSIEILAPNVKLVDSTGAGDTLAGVFLTLLSQGKKIEESLREAVQMASHAVTDFGVEHVNPVKTSDPAQM